MKKAEFLSYVTECLAEAIDKSTDTINGYRLGSVVEAIPHNGARVTITYPCRTPDGVEFVEASEPLAVYAIEGAERIQDKIMRLCVA